MIRWFSANEAHEVRKTEFWPLREILRDHLSQENVTDENLDDPAEVLNRNPRKELAELRAHNGGLLLAYKLLVPWLHTTIRIYVVVTRATWKIYQYQVDQIKTPQQGLCLYIRQSEVG